MLTDSPLDDYQRLCFKNGTPYTVHASTYKSNLAPIMRTLLSHFGTNSGKIKQDKQLKCFEYQFPDLVMSYMTESRDDLNMAPELEANADELDAAIDAGTGAGAGAGNKSSSSTTISKNQQFKLTNLKSNHKTINNNNCILWTDFSQSGEHKEDNFVFLTGIWRLYQDVMKGLIKTPRKSGRSRSRQDFCRQEYDFIISNCFCDDELNVQNDHKFHRRRSTGNAFMDGLPSNKKNSYFSSNDGKTEPVNSQPSYVDFHWFEIPEKVRLQIFDQFEKYLREERHVETANLPKLDDYIQRIRGGYIKIQGTWVPWYVAKLICLRFCFPIRYLLVPIFGEDFPNECEDYFFSTHMNNLNDFLKSEQVLISSKKRRKSTGLIGTHPLTSSLKHKQSEASIPVILSPGTHETYTQESQANKTTKSVRNASPMIRPKIGRNPVIMENTADYDIVDNVRHYMMHSHSENNSHRAGVKRQRKRSLSWAFCSQAERQKLPPISHIMQSIGWDNDRDNYTSVDSNPTVRTISKLASFYTTRGHKYSYPENIFTVSNTKEEKMALLTDGNNYSHNHAVYTTPSSSSNSVSPRDFKIHQLLKLSRTGYQSTIESRNIEDNLFGTEFTGFKINPIHFRDRYPTMYKPVQKTPLTNTYESPVVFNE